MVRLGDDALALLFPGLLEEGGPCRELKHLADALVGLGRALEVLGGLDVAGNRLGLDVVSTILL
jgi:hypothetical protein